MCKRISLGFTTAVTLRKGLPELREQDPRTCQPAYNDVAPQYIQRQGLHLAMEKLEESQKLAAEQRKQKAEAAMRKAESVARALHTTDDLTPAVVLDADEEPARKPLPS